MDDNCDGQVDEGFADADSDGIADCVDACPDDPYNDQDADGVCHNDDAFPFDWCNSARQTSDGGYLLTGDANIATPLNMMIVKTDAEGQDRTDRHPAHDSLGPGGARQDRSRPAGSGVARRHRQRSGFHRFYEQPWHVKALCAPPCECDSAPGFVRQLMVLRPHP